MIDDRIVESTGPMDWTAAGLGKSEMLAEQVSMTMFQAWELGDRASAEHYLARHPRLKSSGMAAARVIYEEFCLRESLGQTPTQEELFERFPQWVEPLRMILRCHQAIAPRAIVARPSLSVGEVLGDYTLRIKLGEGTRGQVFLATQISRGDRPMVLKIAPAGGGEHLHLARLPHAHIVPLCSCHEITGRDLQVLCMPYLGGATLKHVVDRVAKRGSTPLSGTLFIEVLDDARNEYNSLPAWSPTRQYLGGTSYARATCWIGACLAEALQFAHDQGLLHLDLKPSNILLADDGQPMLLDFHLARPPLRTGGPGHERLGGTPAYASPEHRRAIEAIRNGRPIPRRVDGTSDVFGLGAVLHESLTGRLPDRGRGPSPDELIAHDPTIPGGLAAIVCRCLAVDSSQRYRQPSDLAADLRKQLERGATDAPPGRRWWKRRWRGSSD